MSVTLQFESNCNGCGERSIGCHSTCGDYKKKKDAYEAKKKVLNEEKKKQMDVARYYINTVARNTKKKRGGV